MGILQHYFGGRVRGSYRIVWLACFVLSIRVMAQQCSNGMRIEGLVTDPSGAVISGAQVQAGSGDTAVTDELGQFALTCVPPGTVTVHAQADGFTAATTTANGQAGRTVHVGLQMTIAQVETEVRVQSDAASTLDNDRGRLGGNSPGVARKASQPRALVRTPSAYCKAYPTRFNNSFSTSASLG